MIVLEYIKAHWEVITFILAELSGVIGIVIFFTGTLRDMLRKDILDIYDKCKETKTITMYQLKCINLLYDRYKKLKGNSFVDTIMKEKIPTFSIID